MPQRFHYHDCMQHPSQGACSSYSVEDYSLNIGKCIDSATGRNKETERKKHKSCWLRIVTFPGAFWGSTKNSCPFEISISSDCKVNARPQSV